MGLKPPEIRNDCISDIVNDVENMKPTVPSALSFPADSKMALIVSRRLEVVSQSIAMTNKCFLLLNRGNLPSFGF